MKAKRFTISAELFLSLLTLGRHPGGYAVVSDAMPPDGVLLDVRHVWPGKLEVLVASESFEEMPRGSAAELLSPEILILRGLA
ncbi:MAG TPA: hypothetical protein VK812_13310 [Candidatus Binatus sp.]|jgi:hypothetical protein|nr:hypothetical protein [Candidatus Binatus sp.]